MAKKLTQDIVIERFRKAHGAKYNYDFFVYRDMHFKSLILCNCSNLFIQTPMSHLSGSGCWVCADKKSSEKQLVSTISIIERFKKEHADKYNYDFFQHYGMRKKSLILCRCGELFAQSTGSHLSGAGCPECAGNKNKTNSKFIEEAKVLHGNTIDYIFTDYKKSGIPTLFLCKVCGELFSQVPHNHISKTHASSGCPICATHGFKKREPAILYYIKDITNGLYKIGITNRTIRKRFSGKNKIIRVIKTWSFDIGSDAFDREQELHEEYKDFRCVNENFAGDGSTEFFEGDVLGIDNKKL